MLRSLWRHIALMAQPFLFALASSIFWLFHLRQKGMHLPKSDEVVMTGGVIAALAIAFSILAATMLSATYDRYKEVTKCVLTKDKQTFLLYRDERFPVIMHILLFSLALPIVVVIMLLDYESVVSGALAVFSVVFAVTTFLVAVAELQDPTKSPWFAERIPSDWLREDVDEMISQELQ